MFINEREILEKELSNVKYALSKAATLYNSKKEALKSYNQEYDNTPISNIIQNNHFLTDSNRVLLDTINRVKAFGRKLSEDGCGIMLKKEITDNNLLRELVQIKNKFNPDELEKKTDLLNNKQSHQDINRKNLRAQSVDPKQSDNYLIINKKEPENSFGRDLMKNIQKMSLNLGKKLRKKTQKTAAKGINKSFDLSLELENTGNKDDI